MTHLPPVFALSCGVQNYDWGIKSEDGSLVARYSEAQGRGTKPEKGKPYAELWMGTHPSCPSYIAAASSSQQQTLSSYINSHAELLGAGVLSHYGTGVLPASAFASSASAPAPPKDVKDEGALPFLFKVLSVGTALSIQAHPDKELGAKLHKEKPDMYKDPNHKPEMAIAITPFSAFCGFRPLAQIRAFVTDVPEFRSMIARDESAAEAIQDGLEKAKSSGKADEGKRVLRELFANLMKAPPKEVGDAVEKLASRYAAALKERNASDSANIEGSVMPALAQLVVTLNEQYPRDVGVLCTFVLSHLVLSPGEAIFLKANEPHAYLSGDIIECMAASDNVVRAGLTPKARDVDVLVQMLTYEYGEPSERMMKAVPFGEKGAGAEAPSLLYDPPIEEFSVIKTHIGHRSPSGATQHSHRAIHGPSVLIITSGQGTIEYGSGKEEIEQAGAVFFIAAETPITLKVKEGQELVAFRAFLELESASNGKSASL